MNITNEAAQSMVHAYQQHNEQATRSQQRHVPATSSRSATPVPAQNAPKEDSVQLSDNAKLLAVADRAAREGSSERTERVARLREQVQSSTYTVDAVRVAEGLVREEQSLFAV